MASAVSVGVVSVGAARAVSVCVGAMLALAACGDAASEEDLHPEGPPMIQQVRLLERVDGVATGAFAFGTHPLAILRDAHPVSTAVASGNRLRVVVDELLRGNSLEEIACQFAVDGDAFAPIPDGTTPEDVEACTGSLASIAKHCTGAHALCVCQLDAGCPSGTGSDGAAIVTPKGTSVGVLDRDQDGAADTNHLIAGAVTLRCDDVDVPLDGFASFWSPSGNQIAPADGGFDALGPAIVLAPAAMPTDATCGLAFARTVVDKDGNALCAPPDGDRARGCTPGDTSAIHFGVEPLTYAPTVAVVDPGQSRTAILFIDATAPLDPATIANIQVFEGAATPYLDFTATLVKPTQIQIKWTSGLAARTRYAIAIPTSVTDAYHRGARDPYTLGFTTGP